MKIKAQVSSMLVMGCMLDDSVCGSRLDMTTPPWWREKVMLYYYYYNRCIGIDYFSIDYFFTMLLAVTHGRHWRLALVTQ